MPSYSYTLSGSYTAPTAVVINGIGIPVAHDALEITASKLGTNLSRSANGNLRKDWQRVVQQIRGTTPILSQQEAVALQCLLDGSVFHASFDDDLYGDKGEPGVATGAARETGTKKYGAGGLQVVGTSGTMEYDGILGQRGVTVMVWRYESSVWHDYLITYTNVANSPVLQALYKDGVAQSLVDPAWIGDVNFTSNIFQIVEQTAATTTYYDDLVVFPCPVPGTWVAQLVSFRAAQAWPQVPTLTVTGDEFPSTLTCEGDCRTSRVHQAKGSGGWDNSQRVVEFELSEV